MRSFPFFGAHRSPQGELNLPTLSHWIQNATFCCLNWWVDLCHVSCATCCHLSSEFQLESCHAAVAWTPEWRAWKDFVNLRSHGGKTAMTTRISRENNYTVHSVLIRDDFGHYFFTTKIFPQKTLSEQESCFGFQPVLFSTGSVWFEKCICSGTRTSLFPVMMPSMPISPDSVAVTRATTSDEKNTRLACAWCDEYDLELFR